MRGDLADTTVPAICRSLAVERATGRLVLRGQDGPGSVTLLRGAITDASSPFPRARLRERLTGGGHVDELTMARIVHELRETARGDGSGWSLDDDLLAHGLLERQLVAPDVLERLLIAPVLDALVELSARREGEFHFEVADDVDEEVAFPAGPATGGAANGDGTGGDADGPIAGVGRGSLSVDAALREVVRRSDELHRLPAVTRSPETVPLLLLDLPPTPTDFDADALTVLAAVDDETDLGTIAARIGYGFFDVTRVVAVLYARGVVALTEPPWNTGSAARRFDEVAATSGRSVGGVRQGRPAGRPVDGQQPGAGLVEQDRETHPPRTWSPSAPQGPPAASSTTAVGDHDDIGSLPTSDGADRPAAKATDNGRDGVTSGDGPRAGDDPGAGDEGRAGDDPGARDGRRAGEDPGARDGRRAGDDPGARDGGRAGDGAGTGDGHRAEADPAAGAGPPPRPGGDEGADRAATADPAASVGRRSRHPSGEGSDADVSEFLRELSSLANRDDTRPSRKRPPGTSERTGRGEADPAGGAGADHDARVRDGDEEDPERSAEHRPQGPSAPSDDARRRRRGFFGRG